MGRLLLRRYVSVGELVEQPYAPVLADCHDSTDEQTLSGSVKRHNSFARLRIRTSGESLRVGYFGDFTSNSMFTVCVNGELDQTVIVTGDGTARTTDIELPAGADKFVDIWEGPQYGFYEPNIQAGGVITSLEVLDGDLYLVPPLPPARRTVFYGDSISQGFPLVPEQSYIGLLRVGGNIGGVTSYGSGGRSIEQDRAHQTLETLAEKLAAMLSDVRSGGRQDLVIVIGTNDWGQAIDGGAENFQDSIATLVDAVHELQPDAAVHLVSPVIREDEDVPNANGDTLQDYRDAMDITVETRSDWASYWNASEVLTLDDLPDGVHPNATGYQKLATYFEGTVLA